MGLLTPQAMEYLGLLGQSMLGGQSPNAGVNISQAMMFADQDMRKQAALKARLDEERQQAQMRQLAMDKAKREDDFRKALSGGFQPGTASVPFNDAMGDGSGGMIPGQGPSMDFSGAMRVDPMAGFQAQKQWQEMNRKAGPEFKVVGNRLAKIGPDGTVSEAMGAPEETIKKGTTRVIESGRVKFTYEWDGRNWKQIAKSAVDKPDAPGDGPRGSGKAPQGYRWNQDGSALEPIPGGPADAKVGKEAEALRKRESGAVSRADFVLGKVKEAINQTDKFSAGTLGGLTKNIPNTPAYNLNRIIDPIKANIGFAELQAMREASPTGGALGQVAVQELNMLQSVLGSLDTAQSPDQLLNSLYSIEKHFNNWKRAVKQSESSPQQSSQPQADPLGLRQ